MTVSFHEVNGLGLCPVLTALPSTLTRTFAFQLNLPPRCRRL